MKKITILGAGNVAYHFAKQISENKKLILQQIYKKRQL